MMLSLLVVSSTCCISVHDGASQWVIAIFQSLSAPIFTIGGVLSLGCLPNYIQQAANTLLVVMRRLGTDEASHHDPANGTFVLGWKPTLC